MEKDDGIIVVRNLTKKFGRKVVLDDIVMGLDDGRPGPTVDTLSAREFVIGIGFEHSEEIISMQGFRGIPVKIALDGLLRLGDQDVIIDPVRATERQPCKGF